MLRGATGTGKTFVMAHTIAAHGAPTLVLCHNKTLAAQVLADDEVAAAAPCDDRCDDDGEGCRQLALGDASTCVFVCVFRLPVNYVSTCLTTLLSSLSAITICIARKLTKKPLIGILRNRPRYVKATHTTHHGSSSPIQLALLLSFMRVTTTHCLLLLRQPRH